MLGPLLSEAGEGIERLVIVPSPLLAGLPFEALVCGSQVEQPSSFEEIEFVLDRYAVTYGPSSPVLVELASVGPRRERGRVLLLADPLYPTEPLSEEVRDAKVRSGVSAPERFPPLANGVPLPSLNHA